MNAGLLHVLKRDDSAVMLLFVSLYHSACGKIHISKNNNIEKI